jgi:hypothetical protein
VERPGSGCHVGRGRYADIGVVSASVNAVLVVHVVCVSDTMNIWCLGGKSVRFCGKELVHTPATAPINASCWRVQVPFRDCEVATVLLELNRKNVPFVCRTTLGSWEVQYPRHGSGGGH